MVNNVTRSVGHLVEPATIAENLHFISQLLQLNNLQAASSIVKFLYRGFAMNLVRESRHQPKLVHQQRCCDESEKTSRPE